jgi:DNA polymerase-3 subunit alpha
MLDGFSNIGALVQRAKDQGMTALGLTDHGGMYGAVDFYTACQEAGIKPIIGCELYVAPESRHQRRPAEKSPHHLTVLARNNQGYRNLMQLVTKANLEGFYYKPRVDKELLEQHNEGLIVLSGCPSAELSQLLTNGNMAQAEELARWYKGTFEHFYMELQRHSNLPFLDGLNSGLLGLAEKLDIPLVATNDLHYVAQEDAPYQDVMICIQTNTNLDDEKRLKMSDDSYYLKAPEEMTALFHDLPEAVANTEEIANLCDMTMNFDTLHLPEFPTPDGEDADSYLRKLAWQGFEERFGNDPAPNAKGRLDYELDVVTQTQYPHYFLVVWEIVNFAREQQILYGVRGSAASSLVLYCLRVTDIDPLEHGLVFERFLNVERKEMPDIDLDFQDDRRDEAIQHVVDKYGQDHVAQIITFGTLGAKAAIRDVGRALALPFADVDRVARLIPTRLGITLETALEESAEMRAVYEGDGTLRRLIDNARHLEGVVRHASTHAAGVMISKDPLTEYVPLQRPIKGDDQGAVMTQYSMGPLAKLGLLKMDFLGLSNLTILSIARDLVQQTRSIDIDMQSIPFDDPTTYALLGSGETTGLFQLESAGMRRYIKELKPTSLGDLAAMVALYRPGPMEHIGAFIEAKHGRTEARYPHPALREILEETYGIIVYQDQVLHILRTFAGYTLGSADIVRKAMGKKIAALMAQEREKFVAGAAGLGYEKETAEAIFDLIEPFAGYAFNKAHSVSYAVIAYWTGYFKANYPVEYMTAVLNAYLGNTDKVASIVAECVRLGIPVLPPDVNNSAVAFSIGADPAGTPSIRFGLGAVKNVGASAVAAMVENQQKDGGFGSLEEFCRGAGTGMANRRVLESLIKVGGLDALGTRGSLLAAVDQLLSLIHQDVQLVNSGQSTMFDLFGKSVPTPLAALQLQEAAEPSSSERALWERELLGISLSGPSILHLTRNAPANAILSRERLESEANDARVEIVGLISSIRFLDREQGRSAFVALSLLDGTIDVAVWNKVYAASTNLWQVGTAVHIVGKVTRRNDELGIRCDKAAPHQMPETQDEELTGPPVPGPTMKKWAAPAIGNTSLASATAPPGTEQSVPETLLAQGESLSAPSVPVPAIGGGAQLGIPPTTASPASDPSLLPAHPLNPSREPAKNGIGHDAAVASSTTTTATTSADSPRRLLINLTETDHPEDDTYLLRQVMALLLDFPGRDTVDLVIFSQGARFRLEMPIITTRYCDQLKEDLAQLLGSHSAITIQGPG